MVETLGGSLLGHALRLMPPWGAFEPSDSAAPESVVHVQKPVLACRPMVDRDIEGAVALLGTGFPERMPDYWLRALERLRDRTVPTGRPRYGYVMTDRGRLVGILLTIFAETDTGAVRGNVSSWYVEPAYRGFSNLLLAVPLKLKSTTLLNISPAPTTIDTIAAQGFSQYVGGIFQGIAAVGPKVPGARIRQITADAQDAPKILVDHAQWGCLCFVVTLGGKTYPFAFIPNRFFDGKVPCAQLIYCREMDDFVRFAGPLGRRLLRHGLPAVMVDASGPITGLPGSYRQGHSPRFYRGEAPPRLGDLSYTELAIFGP